MPIPRIMLSTSLRCTSETSPMSLNASCRLWHRLTKHKRPSYLGSRCLWTLITGSLYRNNFEGYTQLIDWFCVRNLYMSPTVGKRLKSRLGLRIIKQAQTWGGDLIIFFAYPLYKFIDVYFPILNSLYGKNGKEYTTNRT